MLKLKDATLLKSQNYINGLWVDGGAGSIDVTNPANGELVISTANGDAADAARAVEAAAAAFKTWSRTPAKQRAIVLRDWFNLLMANADDLGAIMTAEQGKPLFESVGEVAYGASFIEYYAEECKRVHGRHHPDHLERPASADLQAAGRCRWLYYTVELSERHDRPQSRPGDGRWLHHRHQARD